jgi:hypothetical protein
MNASFFPWDSLRDRWTSILSEMRWIFHSSIRMLLTFAGNFQILRFLNHTIPICLQVFQDSPDDICPRPLSLGSEKSGEFIRKPSLANGMIGSFLCQLLMASHSPRWNSARQERRIGNWSNYNRSPIAGVEWSIRLRLCEVTELSSWGWNELLTLVRSISSKMIGHEVKKEYQSIKQFLKWWSHTSQLVRRKRWIKYRSNIYPLTKDLHLMPFSAKWEHNV